MLPKMGTDKADNLCVSAARLAFPPENKQTLTKPAPPSPVSPLQSMPQPK